MGISDHTDPSYEFLVGDISVRWNQLENEIDRMIFQYLREEVPVVERLLALMGNVSKGDFLSFLADLRELSPHLRAHIAYFVKTFNILRENRNILQHGVPLYTPEGDYRERLYKMSRLGVLQEFSASIPTLKTCRDDILKAAGYGRMLLAAIMQSAELAEEDSNPIPGSPPAATDLLEILKASPDMFPLPRKLDPILPQADQQGV